MRRRTFALLPLVFLAAGAHAHWPARLPDPRLEPLKLTATLSRSGELIIRESSSLKPVLTLRPGIFEATWQYRGGAPGHELGTAHITTQSGSQIALAYTASVIATGSSPQVRYRCTLTPAADVTVNSAHVAALLPTGNWTTGRAKIVDDSVTIPETAAGASLLAGVGGATLTRNAVTVQIAAESVPTLVQDNRAFGADELEIRLGTQSPTGRVLKAGEALTVELVVTLPGPVTLVTETPVTITAGDAWIPLPLKLDITENSALDFSSLTDAPAGRWGRLVARADGHLGFADKDAPARFYGVNLCFTANFPDSAEADRLATRLSRLGYNAVRLHHHDGGWTEAGNPEKLDYLIAALKKRGIYITTDLYVSRPVPDNIALGDFKAAILVSEPALENWKAYARAFLGRVNPHTGLALKDDPALLWLCVVNEPNLTNSLGRLPAGLVPLYTREWESWRAARTLAAAPLPTAVDFANKAGREAGAFVAELHAKAFARMAEFLRRELGVKTLLTDLNGWSETPALAAPRMALDLIDNHFYWDHPRFLEKDWQLPSEGYESGRSAVSAGGGGPDRLAGTRIFGKPFCVTEFNYSAPNRFRGDSGLLMGAAAALQDWDAVFRFAYAHSRETAKEPASLAYFDLAADPATQASETAAILLFRRGDLRAAPNAVSSVYARDALLARSDAPLPGALGPLAFVTRVGVRVDNGSLPAARPIELRRTTGDTASALSELLLSGRLSKSNRTDLEADVRHAETGEVYIDGGAGVLRILTPRTVGGCAPEGERVSVGPLTATLEDAGASLWVSSLDGKPITESARLLLVHLPEIQGSGTRFASAERRVLEAWGGLPHLVANAIARVTIQRKAKAKLAAWRLDTAGNRTASVPVQSTDNSVSLSLSTKAPDGTATIYYEVALDR